MGVELAVGIGQLAFGRAYLLAGMDDAAFGAHRADAIFVICVLAFRRGIVGDSLALYKRMIGQKI